MTTDAELLQCYRQDRSEKAFTELVQRHIGLVYSCALRGVGHDLHLAQDVTQKVFCDLARKSAVAASRPSLSGWLYVSTHHAAAEVVRKERRRKAREEKATTMEEILHPEPSNPEPDWSKLRPLLDELILQLEPVDREAVILRFFEKRPFAEIGGTLRLSEEAARKRTDRAIEKLRVRLAERGVTSGSGALTFALAGQAATAVPATLAAHVTGMALATAGASSSLMATVAGLLLSDFAAVVATLMASAGLVVWQYEANVTLKAEVEDRGNPSREISALQRANLRLTRRIVEADYLGQSLTVAHTTGALARPSVTPPTAAPVNLVVTAKGTILWDDQPVTLADFTHRLAALPQQNPGRESRIVVHGNPGAGLGAVSYAVEQASRAGIRQITIDSRATPEPADNWITPMASIPGPRDVKPPTIPDPEVHP